MSTIAKILESGQRFIIMGLSPIFVDHKTKRPLEKWAGAQSEIVSAEELEKQAQRLKPKAVAVVCGKVSGGLLVLDFDVPGFYEEWCSKVGNISKSLPTQRTGGGGYQVFLRCPDPGRNDKLAWHPNEEEESGREIAIETRGEGGYVLMPPSLHPSGNIYEWVETNGKKRLTLLQEEADTLIEAARQCCKAPFSKIQREQQQKSMATAKSRIRRTSKDNKKIIGQFNEKHKITDILERYGYAPTGDPKMYTRPGQGHGPSVLIDFEKNESYHFSTNDDLNDNHRKDPFELFLHYEHSGDMSSAIKAAAQDLGIKLATNIEKLERVINHQGDILSKASFTCLGTKNGVYFYFSRKSNEILSERTAGHRKEFLCSLADIMYWEKNFMSGKTVNWLLAANTLFNGCCRVGIFNPDKIRGCGVWIDEDRIVQHNGDHLIVNGQKTSRKEFDTKFYYPADIALESQQSSPLTSSESVKLLEACRQLSWEKPISGTLLAGWSVLAPICGALHWRPHVWITGASGTGKSWVIYNILNPAVGPHAIRVQSNTTEAGLRQKIEQNAFPVVFDEAEGEDANARKNIQRVLELARQASSETGASILKGTISGKVQKFSVRSSFAFFSVNANIGQKADASRITVLELRRPHPKNREDDFDRIKELVLPTITPDYCASLRARTIQLAKIIIRNAEIFTDAFARKFGDRRAADQYGALLAGAYSLTSMHQITPEAATKWIDKQDWSEQSVFEAKTDELRCLNIVLETVVEYTIDRERIRRSIGQIITSEPMPAAGKDAVELLGIKVQLTAHPERSAIEPEKHLIISNSHSGIASILKDTPWAKSWKIVLRRLSEDLTFEKVVKLAGKADRCIAIPFSVIFDNSGNEE